MISRIQLCACLGWQHSSPHSPSVWPPCFRFLHLRALWKVVRLPRHMVVSSSIPELRIPSVNWTRMEFSVAMFLLTAGRFQLWLEPWHWYVSLGHSLVVCSAKDPMKNSHSNCMNFLSNSCFTHSSLALMWSIWLGRAGNFIHLKRRIPFFYHRCVLLQAKVLG